MATPATTEERTVVGRRLAAICDMIHGTPLSARRVAAIAAMIDDLATTAATGRPSARRRKRRIDSALWYEKVRTLGAGTFGVVVGARHRSTGQHVAVKSQTSGHGGGDKEIRRLLREASFLAACQGHPSVVGFRGVARAPGTKDYSLVMEHVGPSLADVLWERGRPFREAEVRAMMRQLLEGAAAMHRHGVVHRDIKLGNILAGKGGALKICDFGEAKSMHQEEAPSTVVGTDGYIAPEMLLWNADYDARVDSWSLGCVMAELLTDDVMFDGEDNADQLRKIFDVLGVPGKRACRTKNKELGELVLQWQERQGQLGHRNRLRELFPEEVLSRDGFEVLKGLLTCDPKKRLTAAAALRCPWFAEKSNDPLNEPAAPAVSNVDGVAAKSWSSQVWQMAMSFAGVRYNCLGPRCC